jgi:hypothetical protein
MASCPFSKISKPTLDYLTTHKGHSHTECTSVLTQMTLVTSVGVHGAGVDAGYGSVYDCVGAQESFSRRQIIQALL